MPELISFENLYTAYRKAAGSKGKPAAGSFGVRPERTTSSAPGAARGSLPTSATSQLLHPRSRRLIPRRLRSRRAPRPGQHGLSCSSAASSTTPTPTAGSTHRALDRCTHYLRRHAYVLPLDVRQFYPSIDHAADTLAAVIARRTRWSAATIRAICSPHRRSIRLPGYDYTSQAYFVTVVVR